MKHFNPARGVAVKKAVRPAITLALLLVVLAPAQSVLAQGKGQSTLSVGITIVATDSAAAVAEADRIPVDPDYAIRSDDPRRDARVERLTRADGMQLEVVTY